MNGTPPRPSFPTVVYIAGSMRSGSTLLAQLLADELGAVSIGETTDIWRALSDDEPCSCGRAASACELWGPVSRSDAVRPLLEAGTVARLVDASHRTGRLTGGHRDAGQAAAVLTLLDEVARVSGSATVVDSTKHAGGLRQLSGSGVDVRPVQLLRDPRAVVNADVRSTRTVPDPLAPPGRPLWKSLVHWIATNLTCARELRGLRPHHVMRYEDLVGDADATLGACVAALGLRPGSTRNGRLESLSHVLVGNPAKTADKPRLYVDARWRHELPRAQAWLVTVVALPVHRMVLGWLGFRRPA